MHALSRRLSQANASVVVIFFLVATNLAGCLRLQGEWRPASQLFHFVARFATEGKSRELGVAPLHGHAFGNITLSSFKENPSVNRQARSAEPPLPETTSLPLLNSNSTINSNESDSAVNQTTTLTTTTLAPTTTRAYNPLDSIDFRLLLLDHDLFSDVYTNRSLQADLACQRMLYRVSSLGFDKQCNTHGKLDLLRSVPCPQHGRCFEEEEDTPGHQFLFKFHDSQPRMWYLAFVACNRNYPKCGWHYANTDQYFSDIVLSYDIWLVNGDPFEGKPGHPVKSSGALTKLARYQFSYELRDLLLLRLAGLVAYCILLTLVIVVLRVSEHALCRFLIAATAFETAGLFAITLATLSFASDGVGMPGLIVFGDLLVSFGRSCLLLILMLLARGWTISSRVLKRPGTCMLTWLIYVVLSLLSIGWLHASALAIPVISSGTMAPEWTTPPGFSLLALRLCALGIFALQLRQSVLREGSQSKLVIYHQFASAALVWFVAWPAVVAVANLVSPFDRQRTLVAFAIVIDAVAISILLRVIQRSLYVAPHVTPTFLLHTVKESASKKPNSLFGFFESFYHNIVDIYNVAIQMVRRRQVDGDYIPLNTTKHVRFHDLVEENEGEENENTKNESPDFFEVELFSADNNNQSAQETEEETIS